MVGDQVTCEDEAGQKVSDELRASFRVPCFCPLCSLPIKGTRSDSCYYRHRVCVNCAIEFIEGREERWERGWRPSKDVVDAHVAKLTAPPDILSRHFLL